MGRTAYMPITGNPTLTADRITVECCHERLHSFDTWDIAETVQSQYATSKRMRAVIDAFWQAINPKADIDLLYKAGQSPHRRGLGA